MSIKSIIARYVDAIIQVSEAEAIAREYASF